uniref:Uncharacterized protein n=1 Tax=Setaria italica TaxID=4555 RepID=K3Y0M0_SETIT
MLYIRHYKGKRRLYNLTKLISHPRHSCIFCLKINSASSHYYTNMGLNRRCSLKRGHLNVIICRSSTFRGTH